MSSRPVNLPPSINAPLTSYKALLVEYGTVTDPTVKAAYKAVLASKLAAIQAAVVAYGSQINAAVAAIPVPT